MGPQALGRPSSRQALALCLLALAGAAADTACQGATPNASSGIPTYPLPWENPTNSTTLLPADCTAWQKVFDGMQGHKWLYGCKNSRNDPCSCRYRVSNPGGVYCTGNPGRIVQIEIPQMNGYVVKGGSRLDDAIGDLTALTRLNVQQDFLTGTLPATIVKLTSLAYFLVSFNNMGGAVPKLPFKLQYNKKCDLGGDCTKENGCSQNLNKLTNGNKFGCPMPTGALACDDPFLGPGPKSYIDRVSCQYCLPGNGCSKTDCGAKDFNPLNVNPKCLPCPKGSQAPGGVGVMAPCELCATGKFANVTALPECYLCPSGKFSEVTGNTKCNDTHCPKGEAAPGGATADIKNCTACQVGTFSPGGAVPCNVCACTPGSASKSTGSVNVTQCQAGCQPCGIGNYSSGDGAQCAAMQCAPGYASNKTGAFEANATCLPCPANTYGLGDASQCTVCAHLGRGWISIAGSATCHPPPTPAPTPPPSGSGTSTGLVVGVALGGVVLLALANEKLKQRRAEAGMKAPLIGSGVGAGAGVAAAAAAGDYRPPSETQLTPAANPMALESTTAAPPTMGPPTFCFLCGGQMVGQACSACGAEQTILDTSNVAKYSVGQVVTGMGNGGKVSGSISAIVPAFGPNSRTGPGKITVIGKSY
jgi:hypothetical protein